MLTELRIAGLCAASALALFFPTLASADSVPQTGFRSTPTDVLATGGWAQAGGGFKIEWWITLTGTSSHPVHYKYAVTNADGGDLAKGLSHIIIQVSENFTLADIADASWAEVFGPQWWSPTDPGNSNPNLPNPIYGLKFDEVGTNTFAFEFNSTRLPMKGSFYAKDGVDKIGKGRDAITIEPTAWNYGLQYGGDPDSYPERYIMVPNSHFIPLPSAALSGLGLLGGLFTLRRQRRGA